MTFCNFFLKVFYGFVLKFNDGITPGTNQVVVMFTRHDMFIARLAVMQKNFTRQTGLGKQLEGAVNSSLSDPGITRLDLQVQLFYTDMLVGGKEYIEDNIALTGGTQSLAGGKFIECFFLLKNHPNPLLNLKINIKRYPRLVNLFLSLPTAVQQLK